MCSRSGSNSLRSGSERARSRRLRGQFDGTFMLGKRRNRRLVRRSRQILNAARGCAIDGLRGGAAAAAGKPALEIDERTLGEAALLHQATLLALSRSLVGGQRRKQAEIN